MDITPDDVEAIVDRLELAERRVARLCMAVDRLISTINDLTWCEFMSADDKQFIRGSLRKAEISIDTDAG